MVHLSEYRFPGYPTSFVSIVWVIVFSTAFSLLHLLPRVNDRSGVSQAEEPLERCMRGKQEYHPRKEMSDRGSD